MKFFKQLLYALCSLLLWCGSAVVSEAVEVDYNRPKKYIVGGVRVEGVHYFNANQIIQVAGLRKGMELTIPGEEISSMVNRLWMQRYFEDVSIRLDSLSAAKDSAYLVIDIKERPRVSRWTFTGVRKSEQKDLMEERLSLRRGGEFSDYVEKTSIGIIERFFKEKGFLNVKVKAEVKKDSLIRSAIQVNFAVDKGKKVKIKKINFIGNDQNVVFGDNIIVLSFGIFFHISEMLHYSEILFV